MLCSCIFRSSIFRQPVGSVGCSSVCNLIGQTNSRVQGRALPTRTYDSRHFVGGLASPSSSSPSCVYYHLQLCHFAITAPLPHQRRTSLLFPVGLTTLLWHCPVHCPSFDGNYLLKERKNVICFCYTSMLRKFA